MNGSQCIITGCEFIDPIMKRRIHGDLHQLYNILIFNANGCKWESAEEHSLTAEEKAVLSPVFYEANSQIVFPLASAEFNLAANIYLNNSLDLEKKHSKTMADIRHIHSGKKNGHQH